MSKLDTLIPELKNLEPKSELKLKPSLDFIQYVKQTTIDCSQLLENKILLLISPSEKRHPYTEIFEKEVNSVFKDRFASHLSRQKFDAIYEKIKNFLFLETHNTGINFGKEQTAFKL